MTLAIETSCDDTSVAVVEKTVLARRTVARLHFHKKVTAHSHVFHGVHPLLALRSHQESLAALVADAIDHLPARTLPDVVSATRGPGMRSNLMCGLDTAKGLAVAWRRPLVGVHHMQAHALTPRLVCALDAAVDSTHAYNTPHISPPFPFLSLLASGGHTLLIRSDALAHHAVLGTTDDIAVGECLDKTARLILPATLMHAANTTMYGALLETFAFPDSAPPTTRPALSGLTAHHYMQRHGHLHAWYTPPANNEIAIQRSRSNWGWSITPPLLTTAGGAKLHTLNMSFSGLTTAVERLVRFPTDPSTGRLSTHPRPAEAVSLDERRDLAIAVQRAAFEHIASRLVRALSTSDSTSPGTSHSPAVVMAGGVASNAFLRHVLAATLAAHGHPHVPLFFPPPEYCTDNAAMIGWAGLEMFEAGFTDPLDIRAVRRWPLDELLRPQYHDKM